MGSGVSNAWSVKRRIQEQTEAQNPLESANLSSMGLTVVPNISKICPLISSLNVSNNIITALPEHLQRFLGLTMLDVSSNQLTTLPEFLSTIGRLKDLRASDNNIRELPDGLVLPSLASLTLCRNYLDQGLTPLLCQSCQSSLQLLHLSSNGLGHDTANKAILILTALVDVDLSQNNLGGDMLTTLPRVTMGEILQEAYALDQTPPVQALSLAEGVGETPKILLTYGNQTKTKLDEIEDLRQNGASGFKDLFHSKAKYATLNLSANQLQLLPAEMDSCRFLRVLEAHHNCLRFLPDLTNCVYLRIVLLSHNKLRVVPLGQLYHGSLQRLDVRHNKIASAPSFDELKDIPSTCVILLDGNLVDDLLAPKGSNE